MSSRLTDRHREKIARIAAAVFPGDAAQPAATELELQASPLDRVLRSRPDLAAQLPRIIENFHGDSDAFLHELADTDYLVLMTVLCAAYVMDERVKNALGYGGQQALTPSRGGFGCEELVAEMLEQPKRYRR